MAAAAAAEGSGRERRNGASGDCAGWRSAAAAGSRGRHRDRVWLWGTGAPARRGQRRDAAAGDRTAAMNGLPAQAQTVLGQDPFSGHVFCFRGRRGDLVKLLWWDGDGLCLFAKRLERGRLVWPRAEEGVVVLSRAQLSMLLEGIDWRMPRRTWRPELAG